MMKFSGSITKVDAAAGVNIHVLPDGGFVTNTCAISRKGDQLNFTVKQPKLSDLSALPALIGKNQALAVNITGKGVLTKRVGLIEEVDKTSFASILPNTSIEDFYVQQFNSGKYTFVTLLRKQDGDRILNLMRGHQLSPLVLSLGPFVASQVLDQLNFYDTMAVFNGHTVHRSNDHDWENISYHPDGNRGVELKIQNEGLREELVIPYASAFQLLMYDRLDIINVNVPELLVAMNRKIGKQRIRMQLAAMLSLFFCALLANLIIYTRLNDENIILAERLEETTQGVNNEQDLQMRINEKERVLKRLGWDSRNKVALVDRIASSLPPGVSVTAITVDPPEKKNNGSFATVVFSKGIISIKGESETLMQVNEWLNRLRINKWVKEAHLDDFIIDEQNVNGVFTILISYDYD